MPPKPFRIAIVTDINFGLDQPLGERSVGTGFPADYCKNLPSRAISMVRYFVNEMNAKVKPDFVVQLGNAILPEDAEEDEDRYDRIVDAFRTLTMPRYHAIGSSELINLEVQKLQELLKYPKFYYSFDAGSHHFIVLYASSKGHSDIHIDEGQRKWLAADLEATSKPSIVFVHHPIDEQEISDNFYFKDAPDNCFVVERAEVRKILVDSGKVQAVFSGHLHRNSLNEHDGIFYVSLQSLVENIAKSGKTPSESFAIVTFTKSEIRVEVLGLDPAEYRLSLK